MTTAAIGAAAAALEPAGTAGPGGATYSLVAAAPFLILLLTIAILPLAAPRWWHKDRNRALVASGIALPVLVLLLIVDRAALLHSAHEYLSFVILLGSLYTISGGIVLRGDLEATPRTNAAFLAIGAVLANIFGTTGASMLLLPPLLRTNSERRHVAHIPLFFILMVSNTGGLLTPLGDPPLFLGYLRGVPFFWTLQLWPLWVLTNGYLLAVFLVFDRVAYRKETVRSRRADRTHIEPLRFRGLGNLALLLIVGASALLPSPWREAAMVGLALLSFWRTPAAHHRHNHFNFGPIREVAIIFAGVFVTMVPALALLGTHAPRLGVTEPWQYFWLTGILSSFLDNAPTYLTFLSVAQGLPSGSPGIGTTGVSHVILQAISAGAVFMGATTYIGNGPNFMVKSMTEHRGLAMPSFFGFAARAFLIMLPGHIALTLLFFRG